MRSRRTALGFALALIILAAAAFVPAAQGESWFSCASDQCEPTAQCLGDYADLAGCTVICFRASGDSGWIDISGMATCIMKK